MITKILWGKKLLVTRLASIQMMVAESPQPYTKAMVAAKSSGGSSDVSQCPGDGATMVWYPCEETYDPRQVRV